MASAEAFERIRETRVDQGADGQVHRHRQVEAEVVLKIVGRRCKIMGFDPPGDTDLAPARTVLVTGSSEQYIATLQSLIAETEDREAGR